MVNAVKKKNYCENMWGIWVEHCCRNCKGLILAHSCHKLCGLGQITVSLRTSVSSSIMFISMTGYIIIFHFNLPNSERSRARLVKSNRKLKKTKILSTRMFRADMSL